MAPCVLVVEDDPDIREAVVEAITDAGYRVIEAENGVEALVLMRQSAPCIVLLDLMMPVMDGWQVAAEMDADPTLASVRVCVVSATERAAPARSVCVLRKPIKLQTLLSTVEEHCGAPCAA